LKFGIKNSAISNWEILQQNQQYHTIPYQQYQIGRLENHKYISKTFEQEFSCGLTHFTSFYQTKRITNQQFQGLIGATTVPGLST